MSDKLRLIALARAFAVGEQDLDAIVARGAAVVGRPARMVRPVAQRYLAAFAGRSRPRHRVVVTFLLHDRSWTNRQAMRRALGEESWPDKLRPGERAAEGGGANAQTTSRTRAPSLPTLLSLADGMRPVSAASTWKIPPFDSVAALAAWFDLPLAKLLWYSDARRRTPSAATSPLHHYHYRLVTKPHGGVRVIEAPQARLKALQQRIRREILEHVPQYYDAAHGFVKGRSVRTFVQPHVDRRLVLRMDLEDFFPCITMSRVQAVFRTMGYPEAVADCLGGLCCNVVPASVFASAMANATGRADSAMDTATLIAARRRYTRPHLPQGAPTSPALANLCAYRLDCRLTGLADWAGAVYTRYADDLAFSGDDEFARNVSRYATQIAVIAHEEGWPVRHRKTRVMRRGVRQQLAGVVVNRRLNVTRTDYDRLKATLTNCVRTGPTSQNRDGLPDFKAHLAGRIAWVSSLNPARGRRLRTIFERINWANDQGRRDARTREPVDG